MPLENISCNKSAGGWHKQYTHRSEALNCDMRFAIYLPPQCAAGKKVPVIYWLSGLTCTDENFMQKAGAQRMAAELGVAIVAPDTSPRGEGVADDPQGAYDFGLGAGFYVNATEAPWNRHYQMYDYIVDELPTLIEAHFPVTNQRAITGHSMGAHGALMIALRNPERYSSASAFSPIANPMNSAWGQKAFTGYLGSNTKNWKQYDSSELMRIAETKIPMLVDQGTHDNFYNDGQLRTETLVAAAEANSYPLEVRMQDGYDHSYYFMASFIDDHLRFHVENFNK
ncbi:S-formylglutathione hydrolase [Photobacterium phosphoreum]|uniref:S-formylglutathione hydrolase n=1 Tax=Photobacterium phosphoreum TaxID=659 RepID=UPI000D1735BC|nr:S-formylglutathione hydrolase [Photobacterium phosphoreum]PTB34526.1 S-formylglutathione hydrolase [Photobacterium phosphoreum]